MKKINNPRPQTPSLFWVWIKWLQDLGGQWQYAGPNPTAPTEPQKRTGRRDPDRKPRLYSLRGLYHTDPKSGVVTKMATRMAWGLKPGE